MYLINLKYDKVVSYKMVTVIADKGDPDNLLFLESPIKLIVIFLRDEV